MFTNNHAVSKFINVHCCNSNTLTGCGHSHKGLITNNNREEVELWLNLFSLVDIRSLRSLTLGESRNPIFFIGRVYCSSVISIISGISERGIR